MEMTKERLEGYQSKKDEVRELQHKLEHLGEGDSLIGNDVIMDYKTGFPRPQPVVGYDYEKEQRLKETWTKRMEKLQADCLEVELWIEAIPDSLTRRIFRMYFVEGRKQKEIAKIIHLDRSRVSRKIDDFLKNAHKAQKAQL